MVRQAQIPFDFGRGRLFAWGLERLDFLRFAQGARDCGLRIWDWGFAAAGARDYKRTQWGAGGREDQTNPIGPGYRPAGRVEAGKSETRSSKSEGGLVA